MLIDLNTGADVNRAIHDKISDGELPIFTGIYAATLTPMHEDFSCNEEELARHCKDLIHRGCKGVILFGTTGEGPSFSVGERKKAIQNLIKIGIDPQKVIIAVSCCAIEDVINLTSVALDQDCAAVLIAPPFFYKKVDEAGVIGFYRRIIQEMNHPKLKI
ncbi:MAG: hypothetical protein CK425_02280, partial [Parachlamydia sp.]